MSIRWWLAVVLLSIALLVTRINGSVKTLFNENDKVIVYGKETFKEGLFGGEKAHLVLLYSSWCGHCQRFAPTYKKFAEDVNTWKDMLEVTGVDCVYDIDVCRQFAIVGYPTIRFIGVTKDTNNTGIIYADKRDVESLKLWTISNLAEEKRVNVDWPVLHPVTSEEAQSFVRNTQSDRPHIILLVDTKLVGQEILLNLQDNRVRYTIAGSEASKILKGLYTGLIVFSDGGQMSYVKVLNPTVEELEKQVTEILRLKNKAEEENSNKDSKKKGDLVNTKDQYTLYELDLQSALNNAFYTEVSLKQQLTAMELDNLKNFVSTAYRCGSWSPQYKQQLSKVKQDLNDLSTLSNADWATILQSAGDETGFPMNSTFIGCKGSQPTTRGYSCSLWLLFHTMLANCYNVRPGSAHVLKSIHGYIDSFFTCSHCRSHFLSMAERMRLTDITSDKEALIAFWEAHNRVNSRLSVVQHDPYFPKVQFPPRSLCQECSDVKGQFNTDRVFDFLLKHYRTVQTPYGKMRYVTDHVAGQDDKNVIKPHSVDSKAGVVNFTFLYVACSVLLVVWCFVLCKRRCRRVVSNVSGSDCECMNGVVPYKYSKLQA